MVSNELFIQFNQKALEPSGNGWGEKSHMTVAAISLWRFFGLQGHPQAPSKLVVLVLGAAVTSTKL